MDPANNKDNSVSKAEEKISNEQKNRYVLNEASELVANCSATLKDFQGGKDNLMIYNGRLYELRPNDKSGIIGWYILGKRIEDKNKEGGLEQNVEKK